MCIISTLKRLYFIDNLDINIDSYQKELNTIDKEIKELETSGKITNELYQSYKEKVDVLIDKISKEYNSVAIVDLYLKKIDELANDKEAHIDEIKEMNEKLISYIEELKMFEKKEYQKVYEKYGTIEDRIMIELKAISDMRTHK